MTIMLVDKDRNQHELFGEIVRRIDSGHKCLRAFSTQSAMEFLQDAGNSLPDYIFLDLVFNAGEGKTMLKALKGSITLHDIPVCIYTNSNEDADREVTLGMGAIGYIVKEANITNLTTSIRSVITPQH